MCDVCMYVPHFTNNETEDGIITQLVQGDSVNLGQNVGGLATNPMLCL